MATTQLYELIAVAVVLIIVAIAIGLFAIRRLRLRKAELLGELRASPRLNADRAYNRLEMARREAAILARQGTDISKARSMIAQSQSAFDLGQMDRAYELAQSAHENLVAIRHGQALPSTPVSTSEPMAPRTNSGTRGPDPRSTGPGALRAGATAVTPGPGSTGLPRNQVESQFEMKLLDSDLVTARQSHPSEPATLAAIDFQGKAEQAFAAGQYTEAFSFALKGRRGLGGNLGTVAPAVGAPPLSSGAGGLDPDQAAERAASASRCPHCGYPTTPDDAFCRGCGTPRSPATCPRCGAPRTAADTFCGRCGERFS